MLQLLLDWIHDHFVALQYLTQLREFFFSIFLNEEE
jgi:hypothetical protein